MVSQKLTNCCGAWRFLVGHSLFLLSRESIILDVGEKHEKATG
jgi:hypothetical protein